MSQINIDPHPQPIIDSFLGTDDSTDRPSEAVIIPGYDLCIYEDKTLSLYIYLEEEDLSRLGDLVVDNCECLDDHREIRLSINQHCLVLDDLNDEVLNGFKNKNLTFCFFKEDDKYITFVKSAEVE